MSRNVVIPALVLVAALSLTGCSGGAAGDQVTNANDSSGTSDSSTGNTQRSLQNSEEVVTAISQAAAEMQLGFDVAALESAAEWTAAYYMDQGDGTRYLSLQASLDQLDGIVAWIDDQDWDGWLIQDTEPGAEATGKFRFLNGSSFTLQEILGDVQSVDVQFFDAE